MNKFKVAGAAALIAFAVPATAQNNPSEPGDYTQMGMIDVADGGDIAYLTFLAGQWRSQQEFAKSKGWIKDYKVYANVNAREGEPDLYLVTTYANLPDAAEIKRREAAYRDFFKRDDTKLDAESADRTKIRTQMGSMLLQEVKFK